MIKRGFLLFACFITFLCSMVNPAIGENAAYIDRLLAPEHIEGEIIVKFKEAAAMANISALAHSQADAIVKREFKGKRGLHLVKLQGHMNMRQALESYLNDPQVEYAGSTSVAIPAGTGTGTFYIIAKADADGVIPELSEINNTKSKSIKIGLT